MSLGSFWKVLGSFGSPCWTGLLVLFPELPVLLFEVFPLVLFLFETDTPTPTPIATSATTPTIAPMSCGDRMDQSTAGYTNFEHNEALAKAPRFLLGTDPLLYSETNRKRVEDIPRTLTCDCQTVASPAMLKGRVDHFHRDGSSCSRGRRLPCPSNLCLKECKRVGETGLLGSSGNRRRGHVRTTVRRSIGRDIPKCWGWDQKRKGGGRGSVWWWRKGEREVRRG